MKVHNEKDDQFSLMNYNTRIRMGYRVGGCDIQMGGTEWWGGGEWGAG